MKVELAETPMASGFRFGVHDIGACGLWVLRVFMRCLQCCWEFAVRSVGCSEFDC